MTLRYDAMADIYKHFLAFGDLKQQYLELDLRAVRPLIMVLKVFLEIIFSHLDGLGQTNFFAAVYSHQHKIFYETSSAC